MDLHDLLPLLPLETIKAPVKPFFSSIVQGAKTIDANKNINTQTPKSPSHGCWESSLVFMNPIYYNTHFRKVLENLINKKKAVDIAVSMY